MTINLSVPNSTPQELAPRITVVGVGGAGGNAVNNMIDSRLEGVDFVVANTDAQSLMQSRAERRIQMGVSLTRGLGAGSQPDIGRAAAEEVLEDIATQIQSSHMVFITAGMGGGTGTGAAPVIARLARESGLLTVGVVTKPFQFEGAQRMRIADSGIQDLQEFVDTLIIIPNQNLFRVANEKTTFADAFKMADDVLYMGVRGVTDLMVMPGLVNLDFADIRSVMTEMGKAMMGTGEAEGESRARESAEAAISNPLLEDTSMKGARGVLINVCGGPDMTLFEVDEAANRIREEVDAEANIIFGSSIDEAMQDRMRVSVVATGIDAQTLAAPRPRLISMTGGLDDMPEVDEDEQDQEVASATPYLSAEEVAAIDAAHISSRSRPLPLHAVAGAPLSPAAVALAPATLLATAQPLPQPQPAPAPSMSQDEVAVVQASPPAKPADAFIPPRPQQSSGSSDKMASPEPFAAAAMVNGAGEAQAEPERSPSLFERVTGTRRARQQTKATNEASGKAEPRITTRPEAAAGNEPAAPAQPAPTQGRLDNLEPTERTLATREEEDVLDIPAFLRRQAN